MTAPDTPPLTILRRAVDVSAGLFAWKRAMLKDLHPLLDDYEAKDITVESFVHQMREQMAGRTPTPEQTTAAVQEVPAYQLTVDLFESDAAPAGGR